MLSMASRRTANVHIETHIYTDIKIKINLKIRWNVIEEDILTQISGLYMLTHTCVCMCTCICIYNRHGDKPLTGVE